MRDELSRVGPAGLPSAGGSPARRWGFRAATAVLVLGLNSGQASAAAVFSSAVSLTATLSLGNGAALSGLGFGASSSFYDANAVVAIPGGHHVSGAQMNVDQIRNPPLPFDQVAQAPGGLAGLVFADGNGGTNHPRAESNGQNGIASAGGTPSGSGLSFTMDTDIWGKAYPRRGFAFAGLQWQAETFFTNLTSGDLLVNWTVNYTLTANAHVDDPLTERAVTETQIFAQIASKPIQCSDARCPIDFIAAADPPLDPPESEISIRPNPIPVAGAVPYQVLLAPGATDSFVIYLEQSGVAEVVPLPQALLFGVTALAALAAVARRRAA